MKSSDREMRGSASAARHSAVSLVTVLGVVVPVILICTVVLLIALLPDDGWTLSWNDRSKFIHPWGR